MVRDEASVPSGESAHDRLAAFSVSCSYSDVIWEGWAFHVTVLK